MQRMRGAYVIWNVLIITILKIWYNLGHQQHILYKRWTNCHCRSRKYEISPVYPTPTHPCIVGTLFAVCFEGSPWCADEDRRFRIRQHPFVFSFSIKIFLHYHSHIFFFPNDSRETWIDGWKFFRGWALPGFSRFFFLFSKMAVVSLSHAFFLSTLTAF